jgi:hypothetical protein
MPLVDKLERIGALLQNGTLSPAEFHQAKDQLLKQTPPGGNSPEGKPTTFPQMDAVKSRAKSDYEWVRDHCLVRDRHYALREPCVSQLWPLFVALFIWIVLGIIAVAGFYAINPALAVLPAWTMFIGFIFMMGSISRHLWKVFRLRNARRKYHQAHSRVRLS